MCLIIKKPLKSVIQILVNYRATTGFLLSVIIPGVLMAFVVFYPAPPPLIVINAETEYVAFRVVRPEIAIIALEDTAYRGDNLNCPKLQGSQITLGLLEPARKSIIQYRYAGEKLAISLASSPDAPSHLRFPDETACTLPSVASFVLKKHGNQSLGSRPLPIAGPGQIGDEYGPPTLPPEQSTSPYYRTLGTMISGELQVFGRTANPINRGTLYPAQNAVFPLPAGGRLASGGGNISSDEMISNASWYGVAMMGDKSLHISVTTESEDLQLFRPGRSSDFERFGISIFARLFSDPSIAPISLFLLFVSISMQAIFGWISTWRNK